MVNTPVFFTSFAAMAAKLSKTRDTSLFFRLCSVAMSLTTAPLVMALLPLAAFMVFTFMAFIAFTEAMVPK